MLRLLEKLFGADAGPASPPEEYDPVYGFSKRSIKEWMARNPRLREEHAVEEWLARNPPLRTEYEAAQQQHGKAALGV